MNCSEDRLLTPIYLRTSEEMLWPEDTVFYMLTGSGLFLCRNNEHFRSCVPARGWPGELPGQEKFLDLHYPRLPRRLLERAVGFFEAVGRKHDAEAALLLAWDSEREVYRLVIPRQRCTVYLNWQGDTSPQGVHYDLPECVPETWIIVGDIHSHVDFSAYSSATDQHDEHYRTGLHIVVGRIYDEPPQFHVEATVDGRRFPVQPEEIFEGYDSRRSDFPEQWFDWLKIELSSAFTYSVSSSKWSSGTGSSGCSGHGHTASSPSPAPRGGTTGYSVAPLETYRSSGNGGKKKGGGRNRDGRGKRR